MPETVDQTPNPQDDFAHPLGDDRAWSESYYFYFADPKSGIAAFTRMGFRANEGWADGLHVVYLGGDRVAFCHARKDFSGGELALDVGGLHLACAEPFRRWTVDYHGSAQDIADDHILITPRKERPAGWFKPAQLAMRVDFDATLDPYYYWRGERGHFEQAGRVTGSVEIGGESWQVDGWGLRDKSWGPRSWKASTAKSSDGRRKGESRAGTFAVWLAATLGPDLAFSCTGLRDENDVIRARGFFQRGAKNHRFTDVLVETEYHPDSVLQKALRLSGTLDDGSRVSLDGDVTTVAPTKIAMPGGATLVNEGLARYTFEGREGIGIAEYWVAVKRD